MPKRQENPGLYPTRNPLGHFGLSRENFTFTLLLVVVVVVSRVDNNARRFTLGVYKCRAQNRLGDYILYSGAIYVYFGALIMELASRHPSDV